MQQFKEDLTKGYIEDQLSRKISYNVINKEETDKRVEGVFKMVNDALARSFGPGGAPTIISQYPAHYSTKDGHHICSSIYMDNKFDQCIKGLIYEISERLNIMVGDGTTTATVSTYNIYNAYKEEADYFKEKHLLPRQVMNRLDVLKDKIIERLTQKATPIDTTSPEALKESIRKVVYISSNGDEELTNRITELYGELMHPAITVQESGDGNSRSYLIDGFKAKVGLTDSLYINNDNKSFIGTDLDVIMFDHKVGMDTYNNILTHLNTNCKMRKRQLVCIAPSYDEVALRAISTEFTREYKENNGRCNLILTVASFINADKVAMNDLSVLLNTEIITSEMEKEIVEKLKKPDRYIESVFDLDTRDIPDIYIPYIITTMNEQTGQPETGPVLKLYDETMKDMVMFYDQKTDTIPLGFIKNIEIKLKPMETTFTGFYYNQAAYDKVLSMAKDDYDEIMQKAKNNGVFSHQLHDTKKRYHALQLKTGIIEYGGTSVLAVGYAKDVTDDAVKAAASAYYNGTILGCNVSLMKVIDELINLIHLMADDPFNLTEQEELDWVLLNIIRSGFKGVYKTVLSNVYSENILKTFTMDKKTPIDELQKMCDLSETLGLNLTFDTKFILEKVIQDRDNFEFSLADVIVEQSIYRQEVYDVTTNTFTKDVINSANTDKEVLKATMDLLSLLITSNQFILQ